MEVKVKNLHHIKEVGYCKHVKDVYAMAEVYPDREETHEQLDKLNYAINHKLIPTDNALSAMPYDDNESVVIAELDMLNDGRMYRVKDFFRKGIVTYANLQELGVVNAKR